MKKALSIIALCLALILSVNVCAFATDTDLDNSAEMIDPRYKVISFIYINFTISDSGRSNSCVDVQIGEGYTVELEVKLQKLDGKWTDVRTWTTTGEEFITIDEPWYVVRGYDYRLRITATVHDQYGNFIEAPFEYSNIVEFY